jgi:hypothetical protein
MLQTLPRIDRQILPGWAEAAALIADPVNATEIVPGRARAKAVGGLHVTVSDPAGARDRDTETAPVVR